MNETSKDYQDGYNDATEQAREDVATALRFYAAGSAAFLTDAQVRQIFASAFGVMAADEEFGPEPSGRGVREKIQPYMQ